MFVSSFFLNLKVPGLHVDPIVIDMRNARNFMVQTEIQYIFVHRAVFDENEI